ncbi:metallophosphoesterase family protein [Pyrodictium occultum]|nr:metallophosphoesterase [Pyrodictium occultum]
MAAGDVHSPRYLLQYMAALAKHRDECSRAGILIWAGDMVDRGRVSALEAVVEASRRSCPSARIVAVFGNEEYMDREEEFIRRYPSVVWLNDTYIVVEEDIKLAIYGSRGVLDRPTRWQRRHIPGIEAIYRHRAERAAAALRELRGKADKVILVTHYAPTRLTLEGEDPRIWPELGSTIMERVVLETAPDLAIHGHAHRSKRLEAVLGRTRVINVALPARGDVAVIDL